MARVAKTDGVVVVGGPESKWFTKFLVEKVFYSPSSIELRKLFLKAILGDLK
jgi:hypothetical protein